MSDQFGISVKLDDLIHQFEEILDPSDLEEFFDYVNEQCTELQEKISSSNSDNKTDIINLCSDSVSDIKEKYISFIEALNSFTKEIADAEEEFATAPIDSTIDDEGFPVEEALDETVEIATAFDNSNIPMFKKYAQALDIAIDYFAAGGKLLGEDSLDLVIQAARDFEQSNDPMLIKQAGVLDELLLTLSAPKNSIENYKKAEQSEIDKILAKNRIESVDRNYKDVKTSLDEQNGAVSTAKEVAKKTKQYRSLEAPLSTRYCPDHPGVPVVRIGDTAVQCSLDKKVYDWAGGFETMKGNKIPGGGVENQINDYGTSQDGQMLFDTREELMSKAADAYLDVLEKKK